MRSSVHVSRRPGAGAEGGVQCRRRGAPPGVEAARRLAPAFPAQPSTLYLLLLLLTQDHALVGVLHQLVHRQGGVVGLHHGVGHLGGRHHREGEHHAVGVLLADLGDQQGAHAGARPATQGVGDLEACGGGGWWGVRHADS